MFVTLTVTCCSPDRVYDDDIIHHDDDPGQAAEDEDHSDHDQHQRESLLAFTEVTDTSRKQVFVNGSSAWQKNIFPEIKNMFSHDDMSVPNNFLSELDILGLAVF